MEHDETSPVDPFLLPGTDPAVREGYRTLAARARTATHGLFEEDVVVVDTETTGLRFDSDELTQIAAVRLRGTQVVDEFSTYVDPGRPIPPEIVELTGIDDDTVRGAPAPQEAVGRFADFAGGSTLVAHNAPFDRHFIMRFAPPTLKGEWIDSLAVSRIALPRIRSHALASLAEAFEAPAPSHNALDDVRALAHVWRVLLVALTDLPPGLLDKLAGMRPEAHWSLRGVFSQLAAERSSAEPFSLRQVRTAQVHADRADPKVDAEGSGMLFPSPDESEAGFSPDGIAGRMYPGYEARPEQVAMARSVAEAFETSTHRAIEAGTGVGKSIAYLIPAVLAAQQNNITVGVATRTNALMDQLVYHELPALSEALAQQTEHAIAQGSGTAGAGSGAPLRYVALKGYDHYPCLRKLERFANAPATGDRFADERALTMTATLYAFACQSVWGDLDAVPLHWGDLPRDEIVCAAADCLRSRCPFYPQRCYLHGLRNRAKSADIVVTNHALLFRDITVDHGILPPIRHWIVDEAHSAESEARKQLSPSIAHLDVDRTVERLVGNGGVLASITRRTGKLDGGALMHHPVAEAHSAATSLEVVNESFWSYVKDLSVLAEESSYDYLDLWISAQVRESGPWGVVASTGRALHKRIEDLLKAVRNIVSMAEQFSGEFASEVADLTQIASSLFDMKSALGVIIDGSDEHYVYAAHINRRPESSVESLEAGLIDVGEALDEAFFPEVHSAIFTSATIATGASAGEGVDSPAPFAHFAHAVGLDRLEPGRWSALRLASGYDFESNMAVYLPNDMPEPNDRRRYLPALERLLRDVHLAMGGSVLTLFTNRREMERVFDDLHDELAEKGIGVICQKRGASPKRLRDQFLEDEHLSLFALRSFWEGFDAPGDTLRCVVITKLPFGRPTDPLSQERGLRDPKAWSHYALPEAVIDFKQAAGRLIRSSTDSGCLVLPDARLINKRYGRAFLDALPTARRTVLSTDDLVRDIEGRFGG